MEAVGLVLMFLKVSTLTNMEMLQNKTKILKIIKKEPVDLVPTYEHCNNGKQIEKT